LAAKNFRKVLQTPRRTCSFAVILVEENMRILWVICFALATAAAQPVLADPAVSDLAARMELHAIETITVSDQQFLVGDKNGKTANLAGVLRFPRGASGRVPAIVLQHGSGGVGAREEYWSRFFNEYGIATFVVDSFSGRGIVQTSTDQAQLGRLNMILDAYRAFDVLANHPRIDPARIAIMGFSRGGQSTLYAAMNRFRQIWNPRAMFGAYIPLYASCDMTFIDDTDLVAAPVRQFHGQADDWVSVAPCRPYFERLRAAGRDAKLTEYPDAQHGYDNPLGPKPPIVSKDSQSTRDCVLKEEPRGVIVNARTGQPFTYADPCVKLDPHTGHNEAATIATRYEVRTLLKTVFKLE
jgi:dienelactone hydrolase